MKQRTVCALAVVLAILLSTLSAAAQDAPSNLHQKAQEMKSAVNEDIVGYLVVPGTDIDGPVVQGPEDDYNQTYLRRNYLGEYDMLGSFMADCRGKFGADLSVNTVIYGHSISDTGPIDDPNGKMFGQLNRYRDKAFCAENPIVYFGDTEHTMAWEVFAVAISNVYVDYINPQGGDEWWQAVEQIRGDSLQDFSHIPVSRKDHILTLSTVDYSTAGGAYPNEYRFVVLAKQIGMPQGSDAGNGYHPDTGLGIIPIPDIEML